VVTAAAAAAARGLRTVSGGLSLLVPEVLPLATAGVAVDATTAFTRELAVEAAPAGTDVDAADAPAAAMGLLVVVIPTPPACALAGPTGVVVTASAAEDVATVDLLRTGGGAMDTTMGSDTTAPAELVTSQ
jgi:hypothetical protein